MSTYRNGTVRVAVNKQPWHDFTLLPGCAFGTDEDGYLFASFATSAKKYGLEGAKDRHIVVFRAYDRGDVQLQKPLALMLAGRKTHGDYHRDFYSGKTEYRSYLQSENMVFSYNGRSYVEDRKFTKGAPWVISWHPTQVSIDSELGRKICQRIRSFHEKNVDTAKKERDRRYAGLTSTFGQWR